MSTSYTIEDTSGIISPALIVFHDILRSNLEKMVDIAGDASRLRPHCKTHKMREVVLLQMDLGIQKQKCATLAEAEMLAEAGMPDIFLAYNIVGPNIQRVVRFRQKFPQVSLQVTADHVRPIAELSQAMQNAGCSIDVLLDLDTGMHRTGIPPGESALRVYRQIAEAPGLLAGGLHVYDGQNHQTPLDERRQAVDACWESASRFRDQLVEQGFPVPRIVAGGTASFPIFAEQEEPTLELSPGTLVFQDAGYGALFPDLDFTPAAVLLTRVISCPGPGRITCDLGYKACASDPPAGQRLVFPELPDAQEVLQNEEHLVLETSQAERFQPGAELLAIPRHICPTSALHKQVFVVMDGRVQQRWDVAARDRWLTI